ncbi:WhiB family transcriptional regulator [Micromonospora fulviviridis]|uniref:WhiB family transcriptional regulator n=1 Tax=Micromonospora fulviviridis TaxID=47860 RepID=UPI003788AC20
MGRSCERRWSDVSQQATPNWAGWWRYAACADWDTEWWTDSGPARARAVNICLACPVQEPCLADGLVNGDTGVIRGGMLLKRRRQRTEVVGLICAQCKSSPVRFTSTTTSRYCGRRCEASARRQAAASRPSLTGDPRREVLPVTCASQTAAKG